MLDYIHNPTERAHLTACALGIHLNVNYESYGGTESLRAMVDDVIVFSGTTTETITYLCALHNKINRILAMFLADGIQHQDKDRCLKSISETCSPKQLSEYYLMWIYENKSLIRYLTDSKF